MRRAGETMPFNNTLSKVQHSYKVVPWTHSADGHLRSGDCIMLRSCKTQGVLAADLGVRQNNIDESYRLHSSKVQQSPVTRNVFQVVKCEAADIFGSDSIVRFGQKIRIQANEFLYKKKLMIGSTPKSMNIFSSVSRQQEASLHACDSYNTQWVVDSCDPNDRFERQGEPVKAGEPILLRHCHTQQYLASDSVVEKNDFGSEFEVSCHSFACQNKTQNLELEKRGNITTDVPTRFQQEQNQWVFETAPDASCAAPIDELQKFNISELLEDIKRFVAAKSSIEAMRNVFEAMDEAGSKQVDAEDFRWGLIDLGYNLSKNEANEVIAHFDKSGSGCLNYEEAISKLCVSNLMFLNLCPCSELMMAASTI